MDHHAMYAGATAMNEDAEMLALLRFRRLDFRNAHASQSENCCAWLGTVADALERLSAEKAAERGRFPENPCPLHPNDGVNVLVCPICDALQLADYMDRIVRAKEREAILSENESD